MLRDTMTKQDGETLLKGTPTTSDWDIEINQVQPEDERNFHRYEQEREAQQRQPKKQQQNEL